MVTGRLVLKRWLQRSQVDLWFMVSPLKKHSFAPQKKSGRRTNVGGHRMIAGSMTAFFAGGLPGIRSGAGDSDFFNLE
jgi:hypothetical protein